MKVTLALLALGAARLLAGCASGEGGSLSPFVAHGTTSSDSSTTSSTGSGGSDAKPSAEEFFKSAVYTAIEADCVSCHGKGSVGPQFLGTDGPAAYAHIKAFSSIVTSPKQSRLLTKGKHLGPALGAAQASVVTAWLELELTEDPSLDTPPELTPVQQLEAFGKCIRKTDWDATNVHRIYKMTAKNQGNSVPCSSCHALGDNGAYLDANSQLMYEATQKLPYILKFASVSLKEDGTFSDIAFANRWTEKGTEGCPPVGNCHPKFVLDSQLTADINTLFTKTYEHWQNNDCVEPQAPSPKP